MQTEFTHTAIGINIKNRCTFYTFSTQLEKGKKCCTVARKKKIFDVN